MIAEALSGLLSEDMSDTELDHETSGYNLEHVTNISTDFGVVSTREHAQDIGDDGLQKQTLADLLREQRKDALCRNVTDKDDDINSMYFLDEKVVLSCRSRLDDVVQLVIPAKSQRPILYCGHDPVLMGLSGGRRMYNTMIPLCY